MSKNKTKQIRVVLTGGGTGGHIFPIVAVSRALKELAQARNLSLKQYFIGPDHFSRKILNKEDISIHIIPAGKLRRYFSFRNFISPFQSFWGFTKSLWLLWKIMPDTIWSKGGYGSFPVALAGSLYLIPLIIHESDTVPGLTNRILGMPAKAIGISFDYARRFFNPRKTTLVGNPVRQGTQTCREYKETTKETLKIKGNRPLILILGGSQGAEKINEIVAQSLERLLGKYEIIHQCGPQRFEVFQNKLKTVYDINPQASPFYHLVDFLPENLLFGAMALSSLIISRAGAGSIFEIAACGKPSILIPLPSAAGNHQEKNAFEYNRTGAAIVISQKNLTPHILENEIKRVMETPGLAKKMQQMAERFAKPWAAKKIAEEILYFATK